MTDESHGRSERPSSTIDRRMTTPRVHDIAVAVRNAGGRALVVGGWVRDQFGAYGRSFTISAILLLVGAALALTLKAPTPEFSCVGPDGNSAGTGRDSA